MSLIAVSHPGKIGDMLWALPTVKELSRLYNCKVDFYTSSYCAPAVPLLQCQSYINKVIIPENYVIEKMDMGIQPRVMPTNGFYESVFHLGFRNVPDKSIPEFIAESYGLPSITGKNISYEYMSDIPEIIKNKKYISLASRGFTTFTDLFLEFISLSDFPVVIIGSQGQYIGKGIDLTYLDFEQMTAVIANCVAFIGLMSAPLVIADGFNIPKIIVHDGKSWDMRHVLYNQYTNYLVNPTALQIKNIVKE
jgi:hypothetical protein